MDVLILAGGDGTRIKTLTRNKQKALLKINNVSLLLHQVKQLSKISKTIYVSIKESDNQIIKEFKKIKRVKFVFIKEKKKLGTAGSLKELESFNIEDLLVIYSDILFNINLKKFIKFHFKKKSDLTLFTHPNNHPYDSDLIEVDKFSRVIKFYNKFTTKKKIGNLCLSGIYIINKKLLKFLKKNICSDFSKDFLPKILKKKSNIFSYKSREYAKDIGTPERYRNSIKDFNSNKFRRGNIDSKVPAIFLDRDGVINVDRYNFKYQNPFKFIDGTFDAIKKINKNGFLAILVTNQPAVAKGFISLEKLTTDFKKLESIMGEMGCYLDEIYFCPCHPQKGFNGENKKFKRSCSWRKPNNGMFLKAIQDLNIDIKNSFMIGDTINDLIAAKKSKIRFIKVGDRDFKYDLEFKNLKSAINYIFKT
jgi:mannose-1-phosphate guanylyltransferase/phosphomannomutase